MAGPLFLLGKQGVSTGTYLDPCRPIGIGAGPSLATAGRLTS